MVIITLLLLSLSLASASHFLGSVVTFTAKSDAHGKYMVEIRSRATYDHGCYHHYATCHRGDCGHNVQIEQGQVDNNAVTMTYNDNWCETETIVTKALTSDRPFQIRDHSCCWVWLSPGNTPYWSILTSVDLGRRSDTDKANSSPDTAILPLLRIPQNCRRAYRPLTFDPDGDQVTCRYGTERSSECSQCSQHHSFQLDQATCTLKYQASGNQGVYGFELVVEDFPWHNVVLFYSDGSSSLRKVANERKKRLVSLLTTTKTTTVHAPAITSTTAARFMAPFMTTVTTTNTMFFTNISSHLLVSGTTSTSTPRYSTNQHYPLSPSPTKALLTTATTTAATLTTTTTAATPIWPTTAVAAATTSTPFIWPTTTTAAATTTTTTAATPIWPTTTVAAATTSTPSIWPTATTAATATAAAASTTTTTTIVSTPNWSTAAAAAGTPSPMLTLWPSLSNTTTTTRTTPILLSHVTSRTAATSTSTLRSGSSPYSHIPLPSWGVPFSQLPLQFTFQVDPPAPSCVEGEYLPMFVPPTPLHGQVLWAEVEVEVEITVRAEAKYSVVDNLIMSGPLNVSKHRRSGDEFSITYTPQHQNLGQHFSICFAVEFTDRAAVYQTEMRCVLLNVTEGLAQVNTVVTCLESSMIVEVEKATLPPLGYDHLRLSDPSNTVCSLQTHSNSTHVVAIVPLNACGTQIQEDDDNLLFKNEITTVDDPSAIITRRHQVEIKFFCQYGKRGNVSLSFSAHRENVTVWDKGFGTFTYGFEFFPDSQFVSRIDPRSYPLEYDVGQRIYMEIQATTTVNNTEMFVESCSAAPYDNPNYHNPYVLIQNGCNVDSTLVVYPSMKEEKFRFSIKAFKFIGLHQKVYIGCSVLMCEAGNPNTRCSRGCQPSGGHRRRRAAATETGFHYVSQGPVRLRTANTYLNLNLVFVSGCAVLAVGMICGVLLYRTRQKSSHEYTLLSSEES